MRFKMYEPTKAECLAMYERTTKNLGMERRLKELEKKLPLWEIGHFPAETDEQNKTGLITERGKAENKLEQAIKESDPELVLEWCTPRSLEEGERTVPSCTYDGCGCSDEEPGTTIQSSYAEARGRNGWKISVSSVKKAVQERRKVLRKYIELSKTDKERKEKLMEYLPKIKLFLSMYR